MLQPYHCSMNLEKANVKCTSSAGASLAPTADIEFHETGFDGLNQPREGRKHLGRGPLQREDAGQP